MPAERTKGGWLTVRSLLEGLREQHVAVDKERTRHSVFLYHRPSDDAFVVEHKREHANGRSSYGRMAFGRDVRAARARYGALAASIQTTA